MGSLFGRFAAAVTAALVVDPGPGEVAGPETIVVLTPDLSSVLGFGRLDGDLLEFRVARPQGAARARVLIVEAGGESRAYDATVRPDGSVFLWLFDGVFPLRMVLDRAGLTLSLTLVEGELARASLAAAAAPHVVRARAGTPAPGMPASSSLEGAPVPPRPSSRPTLWT